LPAVENSALARRQDSKNNDQQYRLEDGRMRALLKTLWLLWLSAALTAFAGNDIRWTEEVKLSDGRIIQVQRRTELTESGFPVQKRGFYKYHEICYPPMGIHWKSKPGYRPDIFDIVDGKAYVHVPITGCTECMLLGYPASDALYFVWEEGRWRRIAHEQFPENSVWNMVISVSSNSARIEKLNGFVAWEDKLKIFENSLHYEQKHRGWKRVNEGGNGIGRCTACRAVGVTTDQTPEVFIDDGKSVCQR
jgi:hypothetical protein